MVVRSSSSDTQHLQGIKLFQGLKPADLAAAAAAARHHRVGRGDFFFLQGDPASVLYVLKQGKAKLTQVTLDGQQVLLRFITPGEMCGAIATLGDTVYPASAQAMDDCLALAWDGDAVVRLMERCPRLAINALQLLADRIREFQDRFREMATERVERRVARTLLRLARDAGRKEGSGVLIDLPLTGKDLAEMTGTTLYTISRIFTRWEQQSLIESARTRVVIRYPHGLVAIAEDLPPRPPSPETAER